MKLTIPRRPEWERLPFSGEDDMAKAQATALKSAAEAAGIDWSKLSDFIKGMNWLQVLQFVQQIISIFSSKPPKMLAGQGASGDDLECIKAHFDAISDLSECGRKCCGG